MSVLCASGFWKLNAYSLFFFCCGLVAISRAMPAGCGRLQMISSRVISGLLIATFQATAPPQSWPTMIASVCFSAFTTAAMSPTSSGIA